MAPKDDVWVRRFVVSDPIKHKKGFTLYKITSVVFPKKHPEAVTKIVVWKRYNDFKKLHKELKLKYQKLQLPDKFPPFVKAKFFRRFEEDVIEERRQAALALLEFVAQNSTLFTSEAFVKFFQCGYSVNNTTGSIEKIEPCLINGSLVQPWSLDDTFPPSAVFSNKKEENLVTNSEDDITSFTTDTDSAISSPLQSEDIPWTFEDNNSPIHKNYLQTDEPFHQQGIRRSPTLIENGMLCVDKCEPFPKLDIGPSFPSQKIKQPSKEVSLSQLWKPVSDLCYYKVLAVYTKVMLVIDTRNDSLHVVKALQKSPCPVLKKRSTIFPRMIPYMVELHAIFETSCAIFLVVQHVSSGKLWDYVTPYFPKYAPKSSCWNASPEEEDPKSVSLYSSCTTTNVTSMTVHGSQSSSISSNNDVDEVEEDSYMDLIKDYTSGQRVNLEETSPKKSKRKHSRTVTSSVSSENVTNDEENLYEQILNYSKSENSLNTFTNNEELLYKLTNDLTLFNLVAKRLETGKTSSELAEKWSRYTGGDNSVENNLIKSIDSVVKNGGNESSSDINLCSNSNNTNTDNSLAGWTGSSLNSSICDASSDNKDRKNIKTLSASQVASDCDVFLDVDDVQTANLVENAKRLLKSVDETLSKSESLESRIRKDVISREMPSVNVDSSSVFVTLSTSASNLTSKKEEIKEQSLINDSFSYKTKNSVIVNTENFDIIHTASPDSSRDSPCPGLLTPIGGYDTTKLHPGSPYSRAGSPVSSVSTDPEAHWWKLEEEGRGLREDTVRRWAAQLLVALNALHNLGITCRDLNPDNILVHEGSVRLTYFCQFAGVEPPVDYKSVKRLYCAPEVTSIFPVTQAADWWSYGVILYELITGQSLMSCHPGGLQCHTILYLPESVSPEAASLLKELLQFNPSERLCSGIDGVDEIKTHPFFEGVDWKQVYNEGLTTD